MTSVKTAKFEFTSTDCVETLLFGSAVSGYLESQLFWHRLSHKKVTVLEITFFT